MAKKISLAPKVDATTMTAMQELASAWIFKRAIEDNKEFHSVQDIIKDKKTYDELIKIWIQSSKGKIKNRDQAILSLQEGEWLENFYKQSGRLVEEIGKPNFTIFTRGRTQGYTSGWYKNRVTFMEWVSDYVKKEFKIQRKDNWNPADVWLIRDQRKHRKYIIEAMKGPTKSRRKGAVEANLNQFNDIFREMFKKKQIMGISLKKVSGDALWKEVNVTEEYFKGIEAIEMQYISAKCKFGPGAVTPAQEERGQRKLELPTKAGMFSLETQETMIEVKDTANNVKYEIQIKANDPSKWDNLKYEPKDKSNPSARLGKATSAYVDDLAEMYGWGSRWKRKWQDYPTSKTKFDGKQQTKYLGMITELDADGVDIGNVTPLEAVINIRETFSRTSQPQTANSKLMQLTWLYNLLSMSTKDRNKMLTDMIYLAEKSGRRYGPYGKLY